jgi:2-keto-myo-inositol isomerase
MMNRRNMVKAAGASVYLATTSTSDAGESIGKQSAVRFALNTSTIRGQRLPITEQVDVTAKAGYDGIEPWIDDIKKYVDGGGSLPDLKKQIADAGITVDSAIGFARWIVDDEATRTAALKQSRAEMELVKAIGGTRVAAPPVGAHGNDDKSPELDEIARRYRALLEVGDEVGVVPQLELWGFSPTLSKLSEVAYVASEAAHPNACILPDFYHIYKGGNDFASLALIEASSIHCFHINDYPAEPPQSEISDKDRVFPGDGICPLPKIIRQLIDNGFAGTFSLELFNPEYWKRDAFEVAVEGLQKSKAVVAAAFA